MEERNWNNEFLGRCSYPRLVWADGIRIELSDERHAAYWDDNAKSVMLGPDESVHAMELALLPEGEELVDLPAPGERIDLDQDVNAAGDTPPTIPDLSELSQAQALEVVGKSEDAEELRDWLLSTRNNQLKKAIKDRLAELA